MNDRIYIEGGHQLKGSIRIQGSKNAALPMMAASLLHRGVSVLKGCPRIADVFCMEEILQKLGAVTWWEDHDLYMDCENAGKWSVPFEFTGRMRSSVILLGALLARNGKGSLGYPGGCVIGKRPIDMHLFVLRKLGAVVTEEQGVLMAEAPHLQGALVSFSKRSVGATQQGILGAVLAEGETVLENCACEPEIQWLCRYMRSMGAKIQGDGTSEIRIQGVKSLSAGCIQVPPDRIVSGTYICAAAITRSQIVLENPPEGELKAFLEVYRKMGGQYKGNSGKLLVNGKKVQSPVKLLETSVYPGFPTDMQPQMMVLLSMTPGVSVITETVFENRFMHVGELGRMGANIKIDGKVAIVEGVSQLTGCNVKATDLRAGAAMILAGLVANGQTEIGEVYHIDRGYTNIEEKFVKLGADIERVTI